uniref:Uncharacterized protein n=1 Tax=Globisporangium ultimum (strain ATCC 200006 / CBS 805.95 / DAOM BR144) TaxID=431595 RepID=K3WH43_GLOUD
MENYRVVIREKNLKLKSAKVSKSLAGVVVIVVALAAVDAAGEGEDAIADAPKAPNESKPLLLVAELAGDGVAKSTAASLAASKPPNALSNPVVVAAVDENDDEVEVLNWTQEMNGPEAENRVQCRYYCYSWTD